MLRSLLVDISPLQQHREYRLLFSGQVISLLGRHLTIVASSIQVFELTGETFAVGLLGVAQFPPLLIGAVLGGTRADAFDRRRILIISQILMALTTVGLAITDNATPNLVGNEGTGSPDLLLYMGFLSGPPPPPNQAPTASYVWDYTGSLLTLDGTGSTDPDGTLAQYEWIRANGNVFATGTPSTSRP